MRIVGMASFMNAAGAQAALLRLMEQLRLRGHETETWYFYQEQPTFADRPNVFTFYAKPALSWWEYARLPSLVTAKLMAARPDAVVTFLPLACVIGQSAAALAGVRKRLASQRTPSWAHGRFMRDIDRFAGRFLYTNNVCVSRAVQESFAEYPRSYRKRLAVIENGLDWKGSPLSRASARRMFGIRDNEVAFVAVGRMKAQKNYPFLLETFAGAPRAVLLIAGDGPQMDLLVAQARALGIDRQVRFLGALAPAAVADLLRAGDVFVQTSTFEGMSNATLEAMAEGLAIVTSDIPMQRDVLQSHGHPACAVLLPLTQVEVWKATYRGLIESASLRAELGRNAKARVRAQFGLDKMIDQFERILLEKAAAIESGALVQETTNELH